MVKSSQINKISALLSDKTSNCLASIHIDSAGIIRLGDTHSERFENFNEVIRQSETFGAKIMIPTYSYTYPKGIPFNILETNSEVGIVNEYIRKKNSLRRTADGMFSYLLFNNDVNSRYYNINDYETFGADSLIGELFNDNGYICCVGGVFHNTPTEIHYIERLLNVPYRSNKVFTGEIIDKYGESHTQNLLFYCRDLEDQLVSDMTRLEGDLRNENLIEQWGINGLDFQIEAINIQTIYEYIKKKFRQNPLYLCSTLEEKKHNLDKRRRLSRFF